MTFIGGTRSLGKLGPELAAIKPDVIATILDITIRAWPEVIASMKVDRRSHEKQITNELRWKMVDEKNRRTPPHNLRFAREEQSDLPDGSRKGGHIDISVGYSYVETEYFAIECKKVTDRDKKRAKYYIDEGVYRFVRGKYSLGHSHASMIGFVCGGTCADSARLIESMINSHNVADTHLTREWQREPDLCSSPDLYSTMHRQTETTHDITLLHLFLAFPESIRTLPAKGRNKGPTNT